MTARIAINGFGRIGRMVLRALKENPRADIQICAINDLSDLDTAVHLLKYDSIHGRFPFVTKGERTVDVGFGPIQMLAEPKPEVLPWKEFSVDLVLECSGRFTTKEKAAAHLMAGAKRVLISAPADGVDFTVVYGVNHDQLLPTHQVVSNGSCTTNCLAPIAHVLHRTVGITYGYMTTIHSYTADQRIVDTVHADLRRARAAALSMIPTSTGAARAIGAVIPELKGRLDGTAIRVPTPNVSLIDFSFTSHHPTTAEAINMAIKKASLSDLKGVLDVVDEPLVSVDFNHNPASASFDLTQTQVLGEHFCRVLAWYDNEWGFANRLIDVAALMTRPNPVIPRNGGT